MRTAAMFDGDIPVGARLRAYDYNPALINGQEVFVEGVVLAHVHTPFLAYHIQCDVCTSGWRAGQSLWIPLHLASNEFDGRVIQVGTPSRT